MTCGGLDFFPGELFYRYAEPLVIVDVMEVPMQLDGPLTTAQSSHGPLGDNERRLPSPTEIADSDPGEGDEEMKTKLEKRKRMDRGAVVPVPGEDDDDDELDSPSKRAQKSDDQPLTSKELRTLLFGHVTEMKSAWREFQGRLGKVEQEQSKTDFEVQNLQSRTKVLEKDLTGCRHLADQTAKSLDALTEEVKNMKVHLAAEPLQQQQLPLPGAVAAPGSSSDPWGEFLRRKQSNVNAENGVNSSKNDPPDRGDTLTEDEKRTLVVGGWLQDTKRSVIEEEAAIIFNHEEMKALIDVDRLAVYGPRRSVGMLKFVVRDGETYNNIRNRMWEVVKVLSRLKVQLASTRVGGECRAIWASFVKTRNARQRSAHASMIRRVAMTQTRVVVLAL